VKQQLLSLLLFVSLGIGGVALFQPKVISFGAALLGIRMTSGELESFSGRETGEVDELEMFFLSSATPRRNDTFESDYDSWDSWESSVPVYSGDPVEPVYEVVYAEPEFDSDFADLAVPLVAGITVPSTSFGESDKDYSVFSQTSIFSEVSLSEPLEEIVLYEAPLQTQSTPPIRRRVIAAPPSGNNHPLTLTHTAITDTGTHQRFHVEANLVEIVPLPGAETVARVGTEIILGCDILPEARKIAYFDIQEMPPEERQKMTEQEIQARQEMIVRQVFPMILERYVRLTLFYCDFASSAQKEQIQMLEKRLGDSFEERELPKLMKQFGAGNRMELNDTLEKLIGSSIDREKALFVRKTFGEIMIGNAIQEAEGECTHEEMLNYYEEHKADFFHRARARWLQLTVNVTPSFTKEQAREKIIWMGNHVSSGVSFEQVARDHSDGFTARNGGFSDWVSKGTLVSDALEQAVFQGPVGALSPIIEDRNAFHIVKVLEREDEYYTPFLQAQSDIKKKIKELRRNKKEAEYFTELFRKFQPETYQNNATNFSPSIPKTALPQGTGTSLHAR